MNICDPVNFILNKEFKKRNLGITRKGKSVRSR